MKNPGSAKRKKTHSSTYHHQLSTHVSCWFAYLCLQL